MAEGVSMSGKFSRMNFDSGSRAPESHEHSVTAITPPGLRNREAPSETDVVDRPFGPDEVELPVPEGKVVHRPYEACDPVVQPGAPHAGLQAFDHLGQQVHGRDRAAEVAGQHFGLMARAAADVGDAQVRTGFGEEFQCPEGLFVATGALPVDAAEKAGYEG